ncbi:MAG TPA: FAD-dependent monooxygenase [Thermomicrobiales bacterium]|nr:FAD-dependent monooxygenase [Thermomicrobiales bacterium]
MHADRLAHLAHDAEAIVVGGGPAGSTFAARLADAGHRVVLLDKASFPRHKPCSDYVSPAGEPILRELGVLDELMSSGAARMEAMIVHAPNGSRFLANFAGAEPGRAATGLTRYHLDRILLERARAAGVTICERAHVRRILRDGRRVVGVEATIDGTRTTIRTALVVGADGHNSVVSRELDLDARMPWPRKTGLAAHYRGVTDLHRYGEMHVGRGAYAGLAILEDGITNLTVVVNSDAVKVRAETLEDYFAGAIASLPEVARKLDGAARIGGIRGVGPMARRARRVSGDGYLLIGDAASFLDPFPGEGVYEALKAAQLAAPVASAALRGGDTSAHALEPYRLARRRAFTAKHTVSWIVQGFVNSPPLMSYVTDRLADRADLGLTLSGVLGNLRPAGEALSPIFLARLLRP